MYLPVLVTCPRGSAERIAQEVLEQRLAACVNTLDRVRSTYWWKDKLESADESLLLVKTRSELFRRLERTVRRTHPLETPEIVAFCVVKGSSPCLDRILNETRPVAARKREA